MTDALNSHRRSDRQATGRSERSGQFRALSAANAENVPGIQQRFVTTLDDWDLFFESEYDQGTSGMKTLSGDEDDSRAYASSAQAPDQFQVLERCLAIVATAHGARGKIQEAAEFYEQSIARIQKMGGSRDPDLYRALSSLANLYSRQGRHREAGALLERAHLLRRRVLPMNHPEVAVSLGTFAENRASLGHYGEALSAFLESIAMLKSAFGAGHYHIAQIKCKLALLYATLGRFQEAEQTYREVLSSRGEAEEWSRPVTCEIVTDLAELACTLGWYEQAEQLAREAMALTAGDASPRDMDPGPGLEPASHSAGQSGWSWSTNADCQPILASDERRLLRLIAEGIDLIEISRLLGVRIEKVRIAVGALMAKLSTLPAEVARQNLQTLITT